MDRYSVIRAFIMKRFEVDMKKNTLIVKIEKGHYDDEVALVKLLERPARFLSENGTVAFPTETVYGLGANALDDHAISQIYEAKGRPSDNPLIVHIASVDMLEMLAEEVMPYARILMDALWPGPITFVFKKRPEISSKVSGGLDTIAVRMPSHRLALLLIELSGKPIAAPSANISGRPSPTSSRYVVEDLDGRVDCIVEGGDTEVGLESTVLDVTGPYPVVLRPGKITVEQIIDLVGRCEIDEAIIGDSIDDSGSAKSPGMKYKHYAPEADVRVYIGTTTDVIKTFYETALAIVVGQEKKVGIMTFVEDAEVLTKLFAHHPAEAEKIEILTVGSAKDWQEYGKVLFDRLRKFDERRCDQVMVRGVEEIGLGRAIMNRLKKASDGKVTRI
ncbi:MAG TPA: threonylcarbamoyl-AMP synthase [Clostridiales bacterium UBA8960]|nr:threonylcarbamoyl-AMP synthase [Clostridiales bacterium UBA8960]